MTPRHHHRSPQAGFTLVEAIVAIVLLGIIGGMVAVFIRAPLQGYKDSRTRAELTDLADLSLRRMERDLRLALPNSIRTNGSTIEFLLTKGGGRYLAVEDESPTGTPLSFDTATAVEFNVVGTLPTGRAAIQPGTDLLVINNQAADGAAPANAYLLAEANRNIAYIAGVGVAADMPTIRLQDNPFATQSPSMPSESSRFQIVSGPVAYHCVTGAGGTGTLYRQWNYAITKDPAYPPVTDLRSATATGAQSNPLIGGVHACSFAYEPDVSGRGGLVVLKLELRIPGEDAMISLVHQVHVDNTP
jgi:MSHA biogenesis protein MshO